MKRLLAAGLVVAAAAAIVLARGWSSTPPSSPTVRFLEPADDAVLPLGTVTVRAEATAPRGVSLVELYVGGVFVEGRLYDGAPEVVTTEFEWSPDGPGEYLLTVRARDVEAWGTPASVFVVVAPASDVAAPPTSTTLPASASTASAPTTRPTPTSTSTSAPPSGSTTTSSSTTSACAPVRPVLVAPPDGATFAEPPVVLEWRYEGGPCPPDRAFVEFGVVGADVRVVLEVSPSTTSLSIGRRLVDCATYRWAVSVVVAGERRSSGARTFRLDSGACG